jgi:hypothetical protein
MECPLPLKPAHQRSGHERQTRAGNTSWTDPIEGLESPAKQSLVLGAANGCSAPILTNFCGRSIGCNGLKTAVRCDLR